MSRRRKSERHPGLMGYEPGRFFWVAAVPGNRDTLPHLWRVTSLQHVEHVFNSKQREVIPPAKRQRHSVMVVRVAMQVAHVPIEETDAYEMLVATNCVGALLSRARQAIPW